MARILQEFHFFGPAVHLAGARQSDVLQRGLDARALPRRQRTEVGAGDGGLGHGPFFLEAKYEDINSVI